jgi:fermentation-respiration switch protein FrsA (DUF1100 family)
MLKLLLRFGIFLVIAYVAICAYMFISQRSLLYLPDKEYVAPDRNLLPDIKEVKIKTEDGLELDGWYQPSKNDYTILYFNGNKSGMHLHSDFYADIVNAGYGLLAFNYRGYGRNAGEPSEQGLYKDARAAIAFLQKQDILMENMIFLGRSLGSGVAVQMASEYLPKAVMLISPYSSIAAIAKRQYPWLPVDLLLQDRFDSLAKAKDVASSTFIFHGRDDDMIPVNEAEILNKAISGSKLFTYDDMDHNNLDFKRIITDFTEAFNSKQNAKNHN